MRKCALDALNTVFQKIAEREKLYLPVDTEKGPDYKEWEEGKEYSRALNTVRSPKDFFFPQIENLMEFKVSGKEIEIIDTRKEKEDFVVFGVRGCDCKAFEVLDRVFIMQQPCDSYYANRREHSTIMTMACTRPSESCFCQTFDIDASNPGGDVSCWMTDESVYFKANTEKGEKLMAVLESVTEESGEEAVKTQQEKTRAIMKKLPLHDLKTDGFGAGKTNDLFDAPQWNELSQSCLGCGTCTFVCPTCQCYDIKDYSTGHGVLRFRCWDSCMYSEFTKMSAGQPRLTQKERFRQRFMHKLVYYPDNNEGMFSCVGCGRCVNKCPISMNIVKVMKTLGGKENE